MDDNVWGNAWGTGELSKPVLDRTRSTASNASDWSSPGRALHDDTEADISIGGAWSPTAATFSWDAQSELQSSVWGQPEAGTSWNNQGFGGIELPGPLDPPSTFHTQPTDSDTNEEAEEEDSQREENHYFPAVTTSPPVSPTASSPVMEAELARSAERSQPVTPRADSPDGFGGFADATSPDAARAEPWPAPPSVTEDAWGSAWGPTADTVDDHEEQEKEDEWEAAKREKSQRDRRVPPEVLRAVLDQCEDLAAKMWPDDPDDPPREVEQAAQVDMHSVPGFTKAHEIILPDAPFPSAIKFRETGLAKSVSTAVKATRHTSVARHGPLSHFISGTRSSAWEASIKASKEVVQDVVPAGWRILEKQEEKPASTVPEKRSGLLSFWGRRASSVPKEDSVKSPSSPTTSTFGAEGNAASPKATSPIVSPRVSFSASRPSSGPSRSSTPVPALTPQSPPLIEPKAPDFFEDDVSAGPAPTAMSRFLNRFARSNTNSGRSSLALSSSDLDALSDIVPSAADGDEDDDTPLSLKALTNMIESKPRPLPTKLPPPLPPPISAPARSSAGSAPSLPPPLAPSVLTPTPSRSQTPIATSPLSTTSSTSRPASAGNVASLFSLPPPPTSRSHTPGSALPPPPATRSQTPVSALPPPPAVQPLLPAISSILSPPSAPKPQSLMALDDDFADFHSSPPPSAASPPVPAFSSPLQSSLPSHPAPPPASLSFDDFDSFSAALPASSVPLDAFDDFDDFVGPSTHTSPPAPAPPSKRARGSSVALPSEIVPTGISARPALNGTSSFQSSWSTLPLSSKPTSPPPQDVDFFADPFAQPPSPQRAPRRSQTQTPRRHSKAAMLNLVEAAKPSAGKRWPAPPSPLPQILAPPPGFRPVGTNVTPAVQTGAIIDLLGDSPAKPSSPPPAVSPPTFGFAIAPPSKNGVVSPPPANKVISPPPRSGVVSPPSSVAPLVPAPAGAAGKSGLSASDLSFFEGL